MTYSTQASLKKRTRTKTLVYIGEPFMANKQEKKFHVTAGFVEAEERTGRRR